MNARVRQSLSAMTLLGVFAFWGGLWMAGERYPSGYDWRYMTISSLLYPDRNPSGYPWAWGGLMLCALGGLCWTSVLIRYWRPTDARRRPVGIWALGLGYVCMVFALLARAAACGSEGSRNPGVIGLHWALHWYRAADLPSDRARLSAAGAQAPGCSSSLCRLAGRSCAIARAAGRRCAGVCLARIAAVALGWPRMACAGRPCLLELCILGVGDLRRVLRIHGEPLSGDDNDVQPPLGPKPPAFREDSAALRMNRARCCFATARPDSSSQHHSRSDWSRRCSRRCRACRRH